MEGEQLTESMDLVRTVGWFTSLYPVVLEINKEEEIIEDLKRVKEKIRNIPRKGIGYGMLKYLREEGKERLGSKKEPEISFNYLGQVDAGIQKGLFRYSKKSTGLYTDLENNRYFFIEINARILNCVLQISITFNRSIHERETIQRLANNFKKHLIKISEYDYCIMKHTLSEFPACKVTQVELNNIIKKLPDNIEDIYPLSPMQNSILSTSISSKIDPYLRQNLLELEGNIDQVLIKKAWQAVLDKHTVLRTGFIWDNVKQPLQYVALNAVVDWHEIDWTSIENDQQPDMLQKLLDADYKLSFKLSKPPLFRCYLIKLGENKSFLLWSIHHIIVDGWCSSIIISDFIIAYEGLNQVFTPTLTLTSNKSSYRDYVQWIYKQDEDEAKEFWQKYLNGVRRTKLSTNIEKQDNSDQCMHYHFELDIQDKELLLQFSQHQNVTLSTTIQAAWAIVVSKYTQQDDVVFGLVVSGRVIDDIKNIDQMTGLFINTLPLRVKIQADQDILEILNIIREKTLLIQQYGYISLSKISNWSGIAGSKSLFDNVFIFENYPVEQKAKTGGAGMSMRCLPSLSKETPIMNEKTEFPLILGVTPVNGIQFTLTYSERVFSKEEITKLSSYFLNIIKSFVQYSVQLNDNKKHN